MDPATAKLDEKQDIQRFQPGSLDREEVAGDDLTFVVREKGAPRAAALAAVRGGRDVLAFEHIPDGRASDVIAQLAQFTLDLAVAPGWVLLHEAEDEAFEVGTGEWAAHRRPRGEGPFASN